MNAQGPGSSKSRLAHTAMRHVASAWSVYPRELTRQRTSRRAENLQIQTLFCKLRRTLVAIAVKRTHPWRSSRHQNESVLQSALRPATSRRD